MLRSGMSRLYSISKNVCERIWNETAVACLWDVPQLSSACSVNLWPSFLHRPSMCCKTHGHSNMLTAWAENWLYLQEEVHTRAVAQPFSYPAQKHRLTQFFVFVFVSYLYSVLFHSCIFSHIRWVTGNTPVGTSICSNSGDIFSTTQCFWIAFSVTSRLQRRVSSSVVSGETIKQRKPSVWVADDGSIGILCRIAAFRSRSSFAKLFYRDVRCLRFILKTLPRNILPSSYRTFHRIF